jgi:hypothetical protein
MALRSKNMKTHMVVIEFAKKYGIKEGLILTELCRRAYGSDVNAVPFSVSQGKAFFPYMSEKQIRLALDNLKAAGSIALAPALLPWTGPAAIGSRKRWANFTPTS